MATQQEYPGHHPVFRRILSLAITACVPIAGWQLGQQQMPRKIPAIHATPPSPYGLQSTYGMARSSEMSVLDRPPLLLVPFPPSSPLGQAGPAQPIGAGNPAIPGDPLNEGSHGGSIPLLERLNQADGLGGEINLSNLLDKPIPAAVRAERLGWQRSGDPLASLPPAWRQPLRQAIRSPAEALLPGRVVVIPVHQLKQPITVPLALRDNGEAETFTTPESPAARQVVEAWVGTQTKPQRGKVEAIVVQLEPLPETSAISKPHQAQP